MTGIKSQSLRIAEAISIRQQLQKLGILVDECIFAKVTNASNDYIKSGTPCKLKLPIDKKTCAILRFNSSSSQQSGVVLEYL